ELQPVGTILEQAHFRVELLEWRDDFLAHRLERAGEFGLIRGKNDGRTPDRALPTAGQRFVLEAVDFLLRGGDEAGLQRGEPILMDPRRNHRAQRVARQLGERMVRDRFAAIEEERDFVAREYAGERVVIRLERTREHGDLAE